MTGILVVLFLIGLAFFVINEIRRRVIKLDSQILNNEIENDFKEEFDASTEPNDSMLDWLEEDNKF